jgi:hypothetical protein
MVEIVITHLVVVVHRADQTVAPVTNSTNLSSLIVLAAEMDMNLALKIVYTLTVRVVVHNMPQRMTPEVAYMKQECSNQ